MNKSYDMIQDFLDEYIPRDQRSVAGNKIIDILARYGLELKDNVFKEDNINN